MHSANRFLRLINSPRFKREYGSILTLTRGKIGRTEWINESWSKIQRRK